MNTEKNYEIRLKMVGEVVLIDGHDDDGEVQVGAITFDFGRFAAVDYTSEQLRAQKWLPVKAVPRFEDFSLYGMTKMLYLALDLDEGKFKGDRLTEAVSNGTLSGCKLRGDVDSELMRELDAKGLRVIVPLIDKKKVN